MRRLLILGLLVCAAALSSCMGGLQRLSVGEVRGWRIENISLTAVDGTVSLEMYNGNKKNITFESGRITLSTEGKQLLVSDLREPVTLAAGERSTVEVPLRLRLSRQNIAGAIAGQFMQKELTGTVIAEGTVTVRQAGSSRTRTIRFRRRIKAEQMASLAARTIGNVRQNTIQTD